MKCGLPVPKAEIRDHGKPCRYWGATLVYQPTGEPIIDLAQAPPRTRLAALRRDYQSMRDMYLGDPLDFDQVIAVLAELEAKINRVDPTAP